MFNMLNMDIAHPLPWPLSYVHHVELVFSMLNIVKQWVGPKWRARSQP